MPSLIEEDAIREGRRDTEPGDRSEYSLVAALV